MPVGATVAWRNDDPFDHTVTATAGAIDSGSMGAGAEFTQSFESAGTFDYFCALHPSMRGTVVVTAPVDTAPECG